MRSPALSGLVLGQLLISFDTLIAFVLYLQGEQCIIDKILSSLLQLLATQRRLVFAQTRAGFVIQYSIVEVKVKLSFTAPGDGIAETERA